MLSEPIEFESAPSDPWAQGTPQTPWQPVTPQSNWIQPEYRATPYQPIPDTADWQGMPRIGQIDPEDDWRSCLGLCPTTYLFNYYNPLSTQQFAYGCAGATPHRLGWSNRQEAVYIPSASTSGADGSFQDTEWNGAWRYSNLVDDGLLFTWTGMSNTRFWSGPEGIGFPPRAAQMIADFQWDTINPGPWNWQFGVTPQVNSDFQRQLTNDAYMVDGRVVGLTKLSPQLSLAVGAAFWNRASMHYIPYGGLIWSPDDRWEVRATFPKSRVSYYLWNHDKSDWWLYATGEYTINAYQINLEDAARTKDRAEFRDYRILLGLSMIRPNCSTYIEGGYITNRDVEFRGDIPGFSISDTWIVRAGIGY